MTVCRVSIWGWWAAFRTTRKYYCSMTHTKNGLTHPSVEEVGDLKEGLARGGVLRDPDGVVVRDIGVAFDVLGREGPVVEDTGVVGRHCVAVAVGAAGLEADDDRDVGGWRVRSL